MNFKIQNKQNQLIERITDQHLVVGVDIAQQVHVARAVNYRGIVIGKPLSFENNEEGFTRLLNWIKELKRMKNLDTTIVARSLLTLAKRSFGTKQALDAYKLHLEQLLEEYDLASSQLERMTQEVTNVLEQIPFVKQILAIKGISAISLAGILGEDGDLSGFAHGNALLRHAGLHLAEASSGK
ncbi:UNVERIFIED_ORG: transposase [Peribacillus simplex]